MNAYKTLNKQVFTAGDYSIVPLRMQDRYDIMQWRNEQQYHLRQNESLTKASQDTYFNKVVAKLFDEENPEQILFSYLKGEKCIGYGGLVHINWVDKNAEVSFVMDTNLESEEFGKHWGIYLGLIEKTAFEELQLHKIFTYAFDLRPKLYKALESVGFSKEAVLKEHCLFDGIFKDVVFHAKKNDALSIRQINESDKLITFDWANDPITRYNSFNSKPIVFEDHLKWFETKLKDVNAKYFICELENQPVGLVRFDLSESKKDYTIGISIDKNFRGKKLATPMLRIACKKFLKNHNSKIIANIKEENRSSTKAFERAGFALDEKIKNKDHQSYRYVYEE